MAFRPVTRFVMGIAVGLLLGKSGAFGQLGQIDLLSKGRDAASPATQSTAGAEPDVRGGTDAVVLTGPGARSGSKQPKTKVRLLADRTAVVPGQSVGLAIAFELQEEWHVYWENPGEGAMAATFNWQLPPGFEVGRLAYPLPQQHVDALGAITFILEGEPVLLTTLKVPADAKPGSKAIIAVDARWLACRDVCVIETARLELTLPVVADEKQVEPANGDEFEIARGRLPLPPGKAKFLDKLSAVADVDRAQPGAEFRVAVVLEVEKGYHINSNKPLIEGFIPTMLFPYRSEGLIFDRPVFPPAKVVDSEIGKLSLYGGKVAIVLPVEASGDLAGREVRIGGVATYQACSDEDNQCYPPTGAEWELILPIAQAGETAKPANAELFGALPAASVSQTAAEADSSRDGGTWLQRAQLRLAGLGVVGYLLMALIGGFILNLTPCVLPVISIKVLSFVQQAREGRLRVFTLGLAFALGIEVSFLAFGAIIMGLGRHLGVSQQWGGLFQSPQVVIGLVAVVTAFALSLFGVFALNPPRVVNELGEKVQREGHLGAFGMGLLATLLGTACTAPFLSMVLAIAVQQTLVVGMLIFAAAGAGMGFPYVLLAAKPAWIKVVPRPGPWMTTFEHLMGFLLLGMGIWLLEALPAQVGAAGLHLALVYLLLVAIAAWVYGRLGFDAPPARKARSYAVIGVLLVGGWIACFSGARSIPELAATQRALRMGSASGEQGWSGGRIPWRVYTPQRAKEAVISGKTVFIDYTADWCKTCLANEKLVLNTSAVREAMERLGVVPFKADFTSYDPEIQKDLARFGRSGVPMYVVIPAGKPDQPILLDEVITPSSVIGALEKAGPSKLTGEGNADAGTR